MSTEIHLKPQANFAKSKHSGPPVRGFWPFPYCADFARIREYPLGYENGRPRVSATHIGDEIRAAGARDQRSNLSAEQVMNRIDAVLCRLAYSMALVDRADEIRCEDDAREWRDYVLIDSVNLAELVEAEVWDLAARLTCYDPAYLDSPSSIRRPALREMDVLINAFMALRDEVYRAWKTFCREEVGWHDHLDAAADMQRNLPALMRRIAGEVVASYG